MLFGIRIEDAVLYKNTSCLDRTENVCPERWKQLVLGSLLMAANCDSGTWRLYME